MRENVATKARRYLTEGRLHVRIVDRRHIDARCRGDSGEVYTLTADPAGWSCSCPAIGRCSHLAALMLITIRPMHGASSPSNAPVRATDREDR